MITLADKEKEVFGREYTTSDWNESMVSELKDPYYLVHYYYPIKDIFDNVYKLTSLIGKTRRDKNGNTMLDAMALSEDEMDYFNDFCREGADEVYKNIYAYMDNRFKSYFYDSADDVKSFPESIHFIIKHYGWVTENSLDSTDMLIKKSIVDYVVFKWMSFISPEESVQFGMVFQTDLAKLRSSMGEHYTLSRTSHPF